MASKKIEIKVGIATISVDVADAKELKKEIDEIKKIAEILENDLSEVIPERVVVRSDLSHIFSTDGRYLYFVGKNPTKRNGQVVLVIYGYGVSGATIKQRLQLEFLMLEIM